MDENPPPKTSLPTIGLILLFVAATLYWAPMLDLAHRGRNASTRDYLVTGHLAGKFCGSPSGEQQQICQQVRISNWIAYGLFALSIVLLILGLIKKRANYNKKDLTIYIVILLFCGFLFFTLSSYRLDKVTEKTPLETYDTQITEHTITYEKETEVTEEVTRTHEEGTYYDSKGNLLKDLEVMQYEKGVGSPCRPWAQVKNPNEIAMDFNVNFTYTIYDIIAEKKEVTVLDQHINGGATTKIIYSEEVDVADPTCQLSNPKFFYKEDANVKKKVKTTTQKVNQTRRIEQNKSPDVYNETKKIARTQYIENTRLVGKWWWE